MAESSEVKRMDGRTGRMCTGLMVLLVLAGCDRETPVDPPPPAPTVLEVVEDAGIFSRLLAIVDEARLRDTLSSDELFTLLAPSDEAFAGLPDPVLEMLDGDSELQARVGELHVLEDRRSRSDLLAEGTVPTLTGDSLRIVESGGILLVDGVPVVSANLGAGNGVIHVLGGVVFPDPVLSLAETASRIGSFGTLVELFRSVGELALLDGEEVFTLLAPTDQALANIPPEVAAILEDEDALRALLHRHLVPGALQVADVAERDVLISLSGEELPVLVENGAVTVGPAGLVTPDVEARNGILHGIDQLLLPEED